mgnify:CR=1 FL=1
MRYLGNGKLSNILNFIAVQIRLSTIYMTAQVGRIINYCYLSIITTATTKTTIIVIKIILIMVIKTMYQNHLSFMAANIGPFDKRINLG